MSHLSLSDSVLFSQDIAAQTSSANVNGTIYDMQGWDGILYCYDLGAIASGGSFTAYVQNSANANMSGAANVAGAALANIANTANTNIAIIDVYRPSSRYVQDIAVPNANVTFGVTAVQYRRSGVLPPTQKAQQVVKVQVN
jgi:hypothetical protein